VFLTGRLLQEASRFLLNLICCVSVSLQILVSLASAGDFFGRARARGLSLQLSEVQRVFALFERFSDLCFR
jgi:hypothetical protein